MKKSFVDYLIEATEGPRIPHPEDSIFSGVAEAKKYLTALKQVVAAPNGISIKWDGGIALFFGRQEDGTFFCSDKYMYPKGVLATSPAQWLEYDQARGSNRGDLYEKIKTIWRGLEFAVVEKAVFKGDLMQSGPVNMVDGKFQFAPTTVDYKIAPDSKYGQLINKNTRGIIVVHQKNNAPWDGKTGLRNGGEVVIIEPKIGISFTLNYPSQLFSKADSLLNGRKGANAESFLNSIDGVARSAIQTYFNKKITQQTNEDLDIWLSKGNISAKQVKLLVTGTGELDKNGKPIPGYLITHKQQYLDLVDIWNAIYVLKDNLVQQLESQVGGIEQTIKGQPGGEGFVFPSSIGLIKLVSRGTFGAAHFNKQ